MTVEGWKGEGGSNARQKITRACTGDFAVATEEGSYSRDIVKGSSSRIWKQTMWGAKESEESKMKSSLNYLYTDCVILDNATRGF